MRKIVIGPRMYFSIFVFTYEFLMTCDVYLLNASTLLSIFNLRIYIYNFYVFYNLHVCSIAMYNVFYYAVQLNSYYTNDTSVT